MYLPLIVRAPFIGGFRVWILNKKMEATAPTTHKIDTAMVAWNIHTQGREESSCLSPTHYTPTLAVLVRKDGVLVYPMYLTERLSPALFLRVGPFDLGPIHGRVHNVPFKLGPLPFKVLVPFGPPHHSLAHLLPLPELQEHAVHTTPPDGQLPTGLRSLGIQKGGMDH